VIHDNTFFGTRAVPLLHRGTEDDERKTCEPDLNIQGKKLLAAGIRFTQSMHSKEDRSNHPIPAQQE